MTRLEKTILQEIDRANDTWSLFKDGDKMLLGMSGGKDSLALYHLLLYYQIKVRPLHIRLSPSFSLDFISRNGLEGKIEVIETEIYDQIKEGKNSLNTCFVCSRERRKKILEYAREHKLKKIIFAHHRNDVVETLLLNLLFSREISTLQPRQDLFGKKFQIIRPLYTVDEKLLVSLQKEKRWHITPSGCEESRSSKREYLRKLLDHIQYEHAKIDLRDNIYSALKAVKPSFLPYPLKLEPDVSSDKK